jgi:DNA invertase Pin-like site-specific DNA recombinase
MLGAIAQFETEIRAERQREGIARAKQKGIKFGAQRKLSRQQVKELQKKRQDGMLIRELMAEYVLSKSSVYRYLKQNL